MKTLLLVVAVSLSTLALSRAFAQDRSPGPITEAVYFRDASGRCLRLQPTLGEQGTLMIFRMPAQSCRDREQRR